MDKFRVLCIFICGLDAFAWSSTISENHLQNGTTMDILHGNNTKSIEIPSINIVGGMEARRNEFPWLVNLRVDRGFCGGSLIQMDVVLTAAHCLVTDSGKPVSPKRITVTAGDHNLRINEGLEQTAFALAIKLHEKYDHSVFKNDIALIRLDRNLTSTRSVAPILLQNTNNALGNNGTIAGWGSLISGGGISETVYKVTVPIVTDRYCTQQLTHPPGQFCAGTYGKDSCQGDSGGPLICNNTNTAPKRICGIVSYGEGCAEQNKPGVYTKVSAYTTWVNQSLQANAKGWYSSSSQIFSSRVLIFVSILLIFSSFPTC